MQYLISLIAFCAFFFLMAIGLIFAKKVLKKGCSMDPDSCACRREGKNPEECDN